jgi:hypothetical protein
MSKAKIPDRIYKLHALFAKLGRPGQRLIKLLSMYSLYVIFTNGGVEALAVICHEYMLQRVNAQRKEITHARTNAHAHANARPEN